MGMATSLEEWIFALLRADKDREVYWSASAQAIKVTAEVPVLLGKTT
jgi:hypothetical protein